MSFEGPRLSVLIVGCGNIAGGFDADRSMAELPLTHVGAFRRHGKFEVIACVDPDERTRRTFMERWGVVRGYAALAEAVDAGETVDVVSICSPTGLHSGNVRLGLALRPRLIFCEKPVSPTAAETANLAEICDQAGVLLAVNHTRRWDPAVIELRDALAAGVWGEVRAVVGRYMKGVLNNGSHIIDLLHFLFGPLSVLAVGPASSDYSADDPSVPALLLTAKQCPVHLVCGHASDYSLFELELITERGVVSMEEGGVVWRERRVQGSPHFRGYNSLDQGVFRPGGYSAAMLNAVENVHAAAIRNAPLSSTGETALAAQRVCEQIRARAQAGLTSGC